MAGPAPPLAGQAPPLAGPAKYLAVVERVSSAACHRPVSRPLFTVASENAIYRLLSLPGQTSCRPTCCLCLCYGYSPGVIALHRGSSSLYLPKIQTALPPMRPAQASCSPARAPCSPSRHPVSPARHPIGAALAAMKTARPSCGPSHGLCRTERTPGQPFLALGPFLGLYVLGVMPNSCSLSPLLP